MKNVFITISFFLFLSIISLLYPAFSFAEILFSDDFESGKDKWSPTTDWQIQSLLESNRFGTTIDSPFTTRETYAGDTNWTDYQYETDMLAQSGEDKNFIFRVDDKNRRYGIHMRSDLVALGKFDASDNYTQIDSHYAKFINNTIYHIKVIVQGNNIKFYSDGVEFINYSDYNSPILNGKIGLRITTGSVFPTSVWFDDVVVKTIESETTPTPTLIPTSTPTPTLIPTSTPTIIPTSTPTPVLPIVFLPGLGGSFNFKEFFLNIPDPEGWQMTPGAKVYNNILKAFSDNPNFYIFYYDWRKSVLESGFKLNEFIKNKVHPTGKVNIVGHSLGGLVARTCIQKTPENCFANKLITVGSPHKGAVQIYPVVEGGEIWGNSIIEAAFELLIYYNQKPLETRRQTIARIAPMVFDLLPNFDFIKKNGSFIPWTALSMKNSLLPQLSDLSAIENITTTIYGQGFPLVSGLVVTDPDWLDKLVGNWPDGKPIEKIYADGDNTVLSESAQINAPLINKISFNFDHSQIISEKESLQTIFNLLGLTLPDIEFSPATDEKDYLIFFVHSPVKISLTDLPPESFANDEMIIVPGPTKKNYELTLTGLANDFYTLSVGQIFNGKALWNDYFDETSLNEIKKLNFNIDLENTQENPLVDKNGLLTKEETQNRIKEFQKEINALSLNRTKKIILLGFLEQISKKIGNPSKALEILSEFRLTLALYEKQKIINKETAALFRKKANNISKDLEFLAFKQNGNNSRIQANLLINAAEKLRQSLGKKLGNVGAFVYSEGLEKFVLAHETMDKNEFLKSAIYSKEALGIFGEVKILK